MEQQRAIAKAIAPALRKQGVQPNLVVDSSSKNRSQGFVPNYNNQPTALEKSKERQGAAKGGYTAGAISTMNVSGLGRVVYNKNETVKKPIKTWSRKSTIIPDFIGLSFLIYNGKKFIPLTISEDMVGHKFGEFAPTRQFFGHTPADKKAKVEGGAKGADEK